MVEADFDSSKVAIPKEDARCRVTSDPLDLLVFSI